MCECHAESLIRREVINLVTAFKDYLEPEQIAKALIEMGVSITMFHTCSEECGIKEVDRLVSLGYVQYQEDFGGKE